MFLKVMLISFIFSTASLAQSPHEKVVGTRYFSEIFGHIHEVPDRNGPSLTGIMCGTRLKVIESKKIENPPEGWLYVEVGTDKGFILEKFTSDKMPKAYRDEIKASDTYCFQGAYPKFFSDLNLNISEQYYWGKLLDQFTSGESKVPVGGR